MNALAFAGPRTIRLSRQQLWIPLLSYRLWKRGLDVSASLAGLVFLAPFLLLIALWIKLEDGGSVLFSQTRVGKGGREFRFWKFRSMCHGAEDLLAELSAESEDPTRFKLKRDPRITRVGSILRRTSLDELPQLFNVLWGDMSLVGPRPALPAEVADYGPRARRRLEVQQGLTCLWQVSGRSLISFEEQIELDVHYVEQRSFAYDLTLLARTIPVVVRGQGAY